MFSKLVSNPRRCRAVGFGVHPVRSWHSCSNRRNADDAYATRRTGGRSVGVAWRTHAPSPARTCRQVRHGCRLGPLSYVAVSGSVGALLRWRSGRALNRFFPQFRFQRSPPTLGKALSPHSAVQWLAAPTPMHPPRCVLRMTGFRAGFTTFSTLSAAVVDPLGRKRLPGACC